MIAYCKEFDYIEATFNHFGYASTYCHYLDIIGEFQDGLQDLFGYFEKKNNDVFAYVVMIVDRLRLLRAYREFVSGLVYYLEKNTAFDLELFYPKINEKIALIEDNFDFIIGVFNPEDLLSHGHGVDKKSGIKFNIYEASTMNEVLQLFTNENGNWVFEILDILETNNVKFEEMKIMDECFQTIWNHIQQNFPKMASKPPTWLFGESN